MIREHFHARSACIVQTIHPTVNIYYSYVPIRLGAWLYYIMYNTFTSFYFSKVYSNMILKNIVLRVNMRDIMKFKKMCNCAHTPKYTMT